MAAVGVGARLHASVPARHHLRAQPHAGAALAAALRPLHAAVVERQREALASLRVELGELAAAGERTLEHASRQSRLYERHAASSEPPPREPSPTSSAPPPRLAPPGSSARVASWTIRSPISRIRSWPRASG